MAFASFYEDDDEHSVHGIVSTLHDHEGVEHCKGWNGSRLGLLPAGVDPSYAFWRLESTNRRSLHLIKKGQHPRVKVLIPLCVAQKHGLVEDLDAPDTHSVLAHGTITDWNCVGTNHYSGKVEVDPAHKKNAWSYGGGGSFEVSVNSDKYLKTPLTPEDKGWVIGLSIGDPGVPSKRARTE